MPKINTPTEGHVAPSPTSGWEWLPYADKGYLATLKATISIIDSKIKVYKPCNDAFKALPSGRNFKEVWNDATVWISFDSKRTGDRFGATIGKDITISAYAIAMGKWTTAATLIHELAHINGASGYDSQAEDTLLKCLLRDLHDPLIIGKIIRPMPGSKLNKWDRLA